jgi:hypothetical protein
MDLVKTPSEALARYRKALECDSLIQHHWHSRTIEGRELACALGILGPKIRTSSECPAEIMPSWLANLVPGYFDCQLRERAYEWGLEFYKELDRLNGKVSISVRDEFRKKLDDLESIRYVSSQEKAWILIECLRAVPTPTPEPL